MPRFDGTGPGRCGPMTGWGHGHCGCGPWAYGGKSWMGFCCSRKERGEALKEYKEYLREELKAVEEREKELEGEK